MISTLGDENGNEKGDFILLDGKTFDMKGEKTPYHRWSDEFQNE